eukprot:2837648-Amphidinium_carterae.1
MQAAGAFSFCFVYDAVEFLRGVIAGVRRLRLLDNMGKSAVRMDDVKAWHDAPAFSPTSALG